MRLVDVFEAMRRRWYAVGAVAVMSLVLAWVLTQSGGTYYSKTVVWFTLNSAPTIIPR